MDTIAFRNWSIAYARYGAGPSVLFLHNGGTSHHIWRDVMDRLQDRYDVIAIDLLGYGASSKPGTHYTMDVYVEMVRTVLDTLNIQDVALVGNCMGSAISVHFSRAYPDRVRRLVLVNPLTEATFKGGWLSTVLRMRQLSPKLIGGAYRTLSSVRLPRWTARTALAFQLGKRGRSRGVHRDDELKALHTSDGQLRSMLEVLADIDAYAALDSPGFADNLPPIYTLWGGANRVLSARAGATLNETLHPRKARTLAACGHLPMMEAPDDVAEIIDAFLQAPTTTDNTNYAI